MNIRQGILIIARITKVHTLHFQETLCRGTDTLESTRIRKNEFEISFGQFKVMFGLGLFFDKGRHFTGVVYEFTMGSPLWTLFVVNDLKTEKESSRETREK